MKVDSAGIGGNLLYVQITKLKGEKSNEILHIIISRAADVPARGVNIDGRGGERQFLARFYSESDTVTGNRYL